jgi:hypothetical protein
MRDACRRAAEQYSWEMLADRVVGVYTDALAAPASVPAGSPATRSVR